MKIYIASHDQDRSKAVAEMLKREGHVITSSWLGVVFNRTETHTEAERREISARDTREVMASDALVLLDSPDKVPGGKFVEMGVALGLGKFIVLSGRRENMLCWHPSIHQVDSDERIPSVLELMS